MQNFTLNKKNIYIYPSGEDALFKTLSDQHNYMFEKGFQLDLIVMSKKQSDQLWNHEKKLFINFKGRKYQVWTWRAIPVINKYQYSKMLKTFN